MSGSRRSSQPAARGSKGCAVPPEAGLRLRAEDADDLAVISACLQDALVSVRDLAYDPEARSFVFVANRFPCEPGAPPPAPPPPPTPCPAAPPHPAHPPPH